MPLVLVSIAGIELEPGFRLPDDAMDTDIQKAAQHIRQTDTHAAIWSRTVHEVAVYFVDNRQCLLDQKAANKWPVNWSLDVPLAKWKHCTFEGRTLVALNINGFAIHPDLTTSRSLRVLDCSETMCSVLDVSNNIALVTLRCGLNILTELDVSQNTALCTLTCGYNFLAALDVSQNSALRILTTASNELEELILSNNPELQQCICNNNHLVELDLSQNSQLNSFGCNDNSNLVRLLLPSCIVSGSHNNCSPELIVTHH